jgi:hypothetical protein
MLLPLCALAAGLAVGLLTGGKPRRLANTRLRLPGLLVAGAALEAAGSLWIGGPWGLAVLIGGYVSLLAFAVANAAKAGMILVAAGLLANVVVIAADAGMPVRGVAADAATGPRHHAMRPGDRLTFLADVVPVAPLRQTVSAGDIVLSIGVATAVVGLLRLPRQQRTRSVRAAARRPGRATE